MATLWPPSDGGAGLLISTGFEPSRALIRFRRRAEPFESQAKSPPLRWLEVHREPPEKRSVLLDAAATWCAGR